MTWILRHRRAVLSIHLLLSVFFAAQLPRARLDNDVANFIPVEHPSRTDYIRAEHLFGGQMLMLVALQPPDGQALSADNLRALASLTRDLEAVPFVDQVLALTTSQDVESVEDRIEVRPIVNTERLSPEDLAALRQRLQSWELYRNALIDDRESAYQIVLRIDAAIQDTEAPHPNRPDPKVVVYDAVQELTQRHLNPEWQVFISGTPVFAVLTSRSMQLDLVVLVPLVVLVLTLTLLTTLRHPRAVGITLNTVAEAAVWSLGMQSLLGVELSLLSTVIPVILMAVGSAYAIHVIAHVQEHRSANAGDGDRQEALAAGVQAVRKPVLLAALTTLAGFGSLAFTDILPVREFGLFACFGVATATLGALTLVPCLLSYGTPIPPRTGRVDREGRLLTIAFEWVMRHPRLVLVGWSLVLVASLVLSSRLVIDNALVEFFPPDSEVARSDAFLRERFAGTKTFSLVFEGPGPGSLADPRALAAMDQTARFLEERFPVVGKVLGVHDLIKRMNQVFQSGPRRSARSPNPQAEADLPPLGFDQDLPPLGFENLASDTTPPTGSRPNPPTEEPMPGDFDEIPLDPARYGRSTVEDLKGIIHDYLFLLGDSTRGLLDDPLEPSHARLDLQLRSTGNIQTEEVKTAALEFARARLPEGYSVSAVGVGLIEKAVTDLIVTTQIANIFQSLLAVFLILLLSHRSLPLALLGLVPLALALPINFGLMGLFGIKLNIATSMVSSIAIGVGIDYTIHFLEAVRRNAPGHSDWRRVLDHAVSTSGRPILINALSVGLGFLVLTFSRFQPLTYLGGLIAVTMAATSLASLTVLPALLQISKLDGPFRRPTLNAS